MPLKQNAIIRPTTKQFTPFHVTIHFSVLPHLHLVFQPKMLFPFELHVQLTLSFFLYSVGHFRISSDVQNFLNWLYHLFLGHPIFLCLGNLSLSLYSSCILPTHCPQLNKFFILFQANVSSLKLTNLTS